MRLHELQTRLEAAIKGVDYVKSVHFGSAYDVWANQQADFFSVVVDIVDVEINNATSKVRVRIYAADRLNEGHSGRWHTWDMATTAIKLAVHNLKSAARADNKNVRCPETLNCNLFSQEFADEVTGVWCDLDITIDGESVCQQ